MEIKENKIRKKFKVKLRTNRIAELGVKAAKLTAQKNQLSEEFSGTKKVYEYQMQEFREQVESIHTAINQGFEETELEAKETLYFATGEVIYYGPNGDILEKRPMTEDERQIEMGLEVPESKEKPSKKKCMTCEVEYIGLGRICHDCKRLDQHRFAG